MPDANVPVTTDNMTRFIEEGRAHLDAFLNTLTDGDKAAYGTMTRWAIKEHLSHLAMWANGIAALLRREERWQAMGLDPAFVNDPTTREDDINAMLFLQHKRRDYAVSYALFDQAHRAVLAALQTVTDEELQKPYSYFQPWVEPSTKESPIWPTIVGNTYGHYEDHLPWMQAVRGHDPARAITINHVAVVVPSIEAHLPFWRDALGLPLSDRREVEQEAVRVAFLDAGDAHLELVEPMTTDSGIASYLEKRGAGMHHICFEVDDITTAMQTLRARDVRLLGDDYKTRDGRNYIFIHPQSTGGVLVELYERLRD